MGPLLSARAETGIKLGAQAVANQQNKKNAKEMAKYQNDIAVDNWHRENAYNSPAMQMVRLKQAGLNPNLIYQSGSAIQPSGSIDQPQVTTPQMSGDAGSYIQASQMSLQRDSVAQNVATQAAIKDYYERLADNAHMDYLEKVANSPYFDQHAKYSAETAMHAMNEAAARVDMTKNLSALYQEQIGLTTAEIDNTNMSTQKLQSDILNNQVKRQLDSATIRQIEQGINESVARVSEILANIKHINRDSAKPSKQNHD